MVHRCCRYYLPGDVALSVEVQDLLARIFRPDPKQRIGLAAMRRHPWLLQDAPSVLGPAPEPAADAATPQSEDGIRDVIRRARQRRLQRRQSGASASGGELQPALARTSQSFTLTAKA